MGGAHPVDKTKVQTHINQALVDLFASGAIMNGEVSEKDLETTLDGWFLPVLRTPSGVDGYEERCEVHCLHLWRRASEQLCTLEVRTCLHDPQSGFSEPDAFIFFLDRLAGSWRLRPGSDAARGSDKEFLCSGCCAVCKRNLDNLMQSEALSS